MHYRGHPNRNLHRLVIDEPLPPETPIFQDGKQVGRITSTSPLPINGQTLALGYLSRNVQEGLPLSAGETILSSAELIGNGSR